MPPCRRRSHNRNRNKGTCPIDKEKLTKKDEMEWLEFFETKKAETQSLKADINRTDKEIDRMVYELFGLSEEEIRIVEESTGR